MQKLTRTQTLALFLGTASALAPVELLNGPGAKERVPEGQRLTALSSGTPCNGNADCADQNEACGSFQRANALTDNICVNRAQKCGAIGRIDGMAFSVQCWNEPASGETASAPAMVDAAAYMTDIEGLITKTTVNWDGVDNMIVSPRYNYQDGWWALDEGSGKWVETDKASDNRCFLDMQCDPSECCAQYPDTNNRRCIDRSKDNVMVTLGPVSFTPFCQSFDPEPVPIVDPSEDLLAEASEELEQWYENGLIDAQRSVGYDKLSKEEKTKFDLEQEIREDKKNKFVNELMEIVGYKDDDCDFSCKAEFQKNLLEWEKETHQSCYAYPKEINCLMAQEFKKEEEEARKGKLAGNNYYKHMSNEEREKFDQERKQQIRAIRSTLVALQRDKQQPKAGEEGGSCSAEVKCADAHLCCGTSTPRPDQLVTDKLENVCGNGVMKRYENSLGEEYDHVCSQEMATKLVAVFAAVATIATSLI